MVTIARASVLGLSLLTAVGSACSLEGFAVEGGGAGGAGVSAGGTGGLGGAGGDGVAGSAGCSGCACGPWNESLVSDSGPALAPSLVWANGAWAVAWQDERHGNQEIYFARVDTAGARLGDELRVTNDPAHSLPPALVWTGSEHAMAYEDDRTGNSAAYLTSVDEAGQGLVLDLKVWGDNQDWAPKQPVLAWGGQSAGYVLAWHDYRDLNYEIHTIAVSAAGAVAAAQVRITEMSGDSLQPAIVYAELEHGIVWKDGRDNTVEIYFTRVDPAGYEIGDESPVSEAAGQASDPAIAFTGSAYGVAWSDPREGNDEIYVARLTQGGVKIAPELRLTDHEGSSRAPSIVWDGSAMAIAWQDDRDGPREIYFARVDSDGVPLDLELPIAGLQGASDHPSLGWSGTAYAVAWQDARDGEPRIYFATCSP